MAASIFPFSHRRYKILMFFFQRNWSPLFFALALALSLLSMSMKTIKFSRKKEPALLLLLALSSYIFFLASFYCNRVANK